MDVYWVTAAIIGVVITIHRKVMSGLRESKCEACLPYVLIGHMNTRHAIKTSYGLFGKSIITAQEFKGQGSEAKPKRRTPNL